MSLGRRFLDLAIEIVIAIIFVGGFLLYISTGRTVNWRLGSVVLHTAVVFGFLISWFRAVWGRSRFWIILLGLLAVHVIAYAAVMQNYDKKIPTGNYAVIDMVELGMFSAVLNKYTLSHQSVGSGGQERP